MMEFPFDARGCCPACGDREADGLLCDACADMVRADPRTPAPSYQNADEYIAAEEQKVIESLWSSRNVVNGADLDFLADLKIVYGGCCGLELNAHPKIERTCADCGKPADSSGYCETFRKYMKCELKVWSDSKFLTDCGIAVEPARGRVYIKIEMQGESVRKARRRHAVRKRKPLMGERRASGCGELDLGELFTSPANSGDGDLS
jgi:hypothetical protein